MQKFTFMIRPNNYYSAKYFSSREVKRKNGGDSAQAKREERRAICAERFRQAQKALAGAVPVMSSPILLEHHQTIQANLFGGEEVVKEEKVEGVAPYCSLMSEVQVYDTEKQCIKSYKNYYDYRQKVITPLLPYLKNFKKSSEPKPGWGKVPSGTSFGKASRCRILEAGGAIQKKYGLGNIFTLTLTLPGSCPDAYVGLAKWSGWLANRLMQGVRDENKRLEGEGVEPIAVFYVWEYQKRGALHMHLCFAGSDATSTHGVASNVRSRWYAALKDRGQEDGIDYFERAQGGTWVDSPDKWHSYLQPVRKDCGAYFSKYASKQASKQAGGSTEFPPPSRFWGCNKVTRQEIELASFTLVIEGVPNEDLYEAVVDILPQASGVKLFYTEYEIEASSSGGREVIGGGYIYGGYIPEARYTEVLALARDIFNSSATEGYDCTGIRDYGFS